MNQPIRETSELWDDVPAKVVGRRRKAILNLERGAEFFNLLQGRGRRVGGRPRGVFRYTSHEEANAWQTIPPTKS